MCIMVVFSVCILCMYSVYVFHALAPIYVFYVRIPCIYSTYVFLVLTIHSMHLYAAKQLKRIMFFCESAWKLCQKKRLDALIIFLIE